MRSFTAIILDDERPARLLLESLIKEHCREVEVIALCASVKEAELVLKRTPTDIAFIDIEMAEETGLEMLQRMEVNEDSFYPIFVTSHAEYAIAAIKENAFDYLLKPVNPVELKRTIKRLTAQSMTAVDNRSNPAYSTKLELKDRKQSTFIDIDRITFLKAEGSYTRIHTKTEDYLVSKNLKQYADQLNAMKFVRVSHDLIINLREVDRFVHEGNFVYLKDNSCLHVSKRRKEAFLKLMREV